MNKKSLEKFFGLLFSVIGLICIIICIVQNEKNNALLPVGLMSNNIALVILFIMNRTDKKNK